MALIDKQYLETPYYGSRRMQQFLQRQGHKVGRGKVRRLMKLIGLTAIYQKPCTTIPDKAQKKCPYLLRGLEIHRPNQVWCMDSTYIPVEHGFLSVGGWSNMSVCSSMTRRLARRFGLALENGSPIIKATGCFRQWITRPQMKSIQARDLKFAPWHKLYQIFLKQR